MPGNTPPEVAPFPLKYTIPLHSFFDISHLTATPDNQLYLGAPEKAPQPGTHIVNLVARTDNSQLPIGDFFSIPEITPTPTQHSVLLHPYNEVSKDIPEISNRDLPQITVNLDLNEPLSSGESVLKTEQMIETSTSEKEASVPTTQPTLLAKRPDNDSLGSSIVEVDASVASMLVLTNIAEGKAIMNEPSLRHLARAAFSVIQSVMPLKDHKNDFMTLAKEVENIILGIYFAYTSSENQQTWLKIETVMMLMEFHQMLREMERLVRRLTIESSSMRSFTSAYDEENIKKCFEDFKKTKEQFMDVMQIRSFETLDIDEMCKAELAEQKRGAAL